MLNILKMAYASRAMSVPEPTKEGEGKEDEHKSAEALRLCASTQGYPAH